MNVAITIAAVALALGTFTGEIGPIVRGVSVLQTALLFGGICGVAGALYAIYYMRSEFEAAHMHVPDYFFLIESGLWITAASYVGVLFAQLP